MKIKSFMLSLITFSLFTAQLVFAHSSGHGGPAISEERAVSAASENVAMIVNQNVDIDNGKLDTSWSTLPEADKAIYKKGRGYFIVSFNNKAQDKTLYVLLSDQGEFYNANYSGKFTGVQE